MLTAGTPDYKDGVVEIRKRNKLWTTQSKVELEMEVLFVLVTQKRGSILLHAPKGEDGTDHQQNVLNLHTYVDLNALTSPKLIAGVFLLCFHKS